MTIFLLCDLCFPTASFNKIKPFLNGNQSKITNYPTEGVVAIRRMLEGRVLDKPRNIAKRTIKEFDRASKAASVNVVPPVSNLTATKRSIGYIQKYGGKDLEDSIEKMSAKEQYKTGSQVGRLQKRLQSIGLEHQDIHEKNIVKPNRRKKKVYLIDNESLAKTRGTLKRDYSMTEPFNIGYEYGIQ